METEKGHGSPIAGSPAQFARIAMALAEESSVATVSARILGFLAVVTGCDSGSIGLVGRRGVLRPAGASRAVEEVLYDGLVTIGSGPADAALAAAVPIQVLDITAEDRWPQWCLTAAQADIGSVLSVPLSTANASLGALSCYWRRPHAFGRSTVARAVVLARHASLALAAAKAQEGLRMSVSTRTIIGQAQGILMERYGIGDDKAFEVLRRYSQDGNVKLFDVAARIVATRRLPESR